MIIVNCHSCDATYRLRDESAGRRFRCKSCDAIVKIPDRTRRRSSRPTSSSESQRRSPPKRRRPSRNDDYNDDDANDVYEDYQDDYEDDVPTRRRRRGTDARRSRSGTRRRGEANSLFQRIRQAVPRTRSDGTWVGKYSADPLIWGGVPCGVFALTVAAFLSSDLALMVSGRLAGFITLGVFVIAILGAVITFGMAMVSGFGMLIQLSGDPKVSRAKLFFLPGYLIYCIFADWKRYRKLFIFQCSVLMTWPAFGLGWLISGLISTLLFVFR